MLVNITYLPVLFEVKKSPGGSGDPYIDFSLGISGAGKRGNVTHTPEDILKVVIVDK